MRRIAAGCDRRPAYHIPRYRAAEQYRAILRRRTADERRRLAQIKRLLERHHADPRFRAKLGAAGADQRSVAAAYGITIDPREVLPLFDGAYADLRDAAEADSWPTVRAWDAYLSDLRQLPAAFREAGNCPDASPRFDAWRQRQIRRAQSELGALSGHILKDLAFTRRTMHLHDEHGCMPNRFSILNLKALDRVHAMFTPEELLGVDLVLQNREAMVPTAFAGRARRDGDKFRAQGNAGPGEADGATIACVSGWRRGSNDRAGLRHPGGVDGEAGCQGRGERRCRVHGTSSKSGGVFGPNIKIR